MSAPGHSSFLGLSARPFPWERAFLLAAAFIVSDALVSCLGFMQTHSSGAGWTYSWFNIAAPVDFLSRVILNILRVTLVVLAVRLIGRVVWGLVLGALAAGLLNPTLAYLQIGISGHGWRDATWLIGHVLTSAAWTLGFFGTLAVALGVIRQVGLALVAGGLAGELVGGLASGVVAQLTGASDDWSITLGFFVHGLRVNLLGGALFGLLLWAGLAAAGSLREDAPQLFVRRPFFTGTFVAFNGVSLTLVLVMRLFVVLGVWGPSPSSHVYGATSAMEMAMGLLALAVLIMLIAIAGSLVFLRLVYRMWAAIQAGPARMTPGKAVGFLFIPFFNLYWVFQVVVGFATDFNALARQKGLTLAPLPCGLFIAFVVCSLLGGIPLLEIAAVAAYVLGIMVIRRVCDAVNALVLADAGAQASLG